MAAKHRRTKDKDLDENESDDSSSGVDVLKRLKTISHVKREQEKKSKRTKKVLNKLCDSEDNSDNEPRKRPMSSLPISRKHSKTRTSSISDDSSSDSSYFEESKRRVKKSMTKRKKKSSSESDLDSGQKKKNNKRPRIASKERTSITSNKGTKNKSMSLEKDDSDSSSSKEFQKPKSKKNKSLRRTSNTGETTFDDYTVVETPSKSDDESIPVEAKEEVKLKHYIIEETEKINRLAEELKNDLECQSSYLIKKKVNFVRDSKFFAHKILRIYDETYKKLKENRTNFADTYKSWINTCSDSRKPVTKKTTKKSYNLSYKSDEDHDVSKNDTRLSDIAPIKPSKRDKSPDETHESDKSKKKFKKSAKQKDSSDESDDDTAIKMNKKSAKKNIGTNESNESDDNNATKEIEKSAKQNSSVDESHESDDAIKKNKISVKENSDSDEMHESSKSPKSIDNESMKKSTKFSKENSGSDESNESDKSHESDDDQAFEKNKSTKQNSDLDELHESDESHKSENKKEMKKNKKPMNNSECSDKLHESEDDKCTKKNKKTDKKISQQNQRSSNSPTKSIEENSKSSDSDVNEENETVKNDSKSQKKKNLSLSKKTSSKDDSELDSEKNMSNSEENVKSKKSSNLKDKSNALKNNKSISEIACDINKDKEIEETNDSTGQVSECDSEEIFSGDEVRSKRKVNAKTEKSKTDKNEDPSKNSSEQIDVTNSDSSCEDMFESTVSEVANTPVKSPILSSNKSLRKTLLLNSKPTDLDEIIDKSVNDNDEEVNNSDDNASLKSNNKEPSPESLPVNEELSSNEADVEGDADADADAEDIERKARDKLLYNFDSDDSTDSSNEDKLSSPKSEKSVDSSCSTVIASQNKKNKSAIQKTKNTTKKLKKLPLQTKKRNSISSDSSSDSGEDDNRKKRTKNGGSLSSTKKRRQRAFNVWKNPHYRADKKLQMECQVTLERLSQKVLDKHSRALEKSKKYVDNKKFHSITNLDGLENQKKSKKLAVAELSDGDIVTKTKSRKKKGDKKEVLKDHLDDDNDINNEISDNDLSDKTNGKQLFSDDTFEDIVDEVENNAKDILLNSSSSNEDENGMDVDKTSTSDVNKKDRKKSKKANAKSSKNDDASIEIMDQQSDDEQEDKKEKSKWKQDDLLNFHMTDTESEEEKFLKSQEKKQAKKSKKEENDDPDEESPVKTTTKKSRKPRKKKRILDSDTDAKISSDEGSSSDKASDSEEEKEKEDQKKKSKRRRKKSSSDTSSSEKKPKNKRRRIKKVATDSESDDQDSPNKGRKNIRKVLKDKHVADDTKKAAQDEEERLKRIAERQKLFNEMYDARLAGEAKVDQLVLDVDEETKEELVVVDKELVKRLKPHQAKGIKFMWDACFESLQQIEKSDGSGCIIAHCMGLGKTFQVVTLAHTLLTHEDTKVNTVMVVCPLSTVLNWVNEFKTWLKHVKDGDDIEIYELTKSKKNIERKYMLESWQKTGGVLIIGYEMFRNLTSTGKKMRKAMQESIMRSLVDPGADLVVCDEGHLLKNEDSALSKAMRLVKTRRRVVLTGTPLQNNLKEYHCMVQFVKPNLLGTKKEFLNRFVNPITNGQFDDSTPYDVKLMKKRAHVLHKMLEGSVQRFDYSVLTPFLPPKQEYVIFVRLTEKQIKMYQHYLDNFARRYGQRNGSLFADFQELQRIWTHPYVLRLNAEKVEKANEKKRLEASDSEGSLKDFIDDVSESESIHSLSSSSDTNSDVQCVDSDAEKPIVKTRSTRLNPKEEPEEIVPTPQTAEEAAWWSQFVEEKDFIDLRISTKLILLFGILKESEQIGDKVLVFSQSLYSLTLIEQFLNLIDQESQNDAEAEHLDNHSGTWSLGLDYFRLDGSTSAENRSAWCKIFNNPTNNRARLFLISTRAGGLGINLTAANRVIIFDASWNPSHDVQSIFRIYRFGQKKPCYVYRFLAAGTMEEKIYNRQVTKLSLACRVVDEQQIERHYSNNDLAELYQFESYEGQSQTLALPKDRLLAEIFLKYKDAVWNYHEHDSLLENKEEEELDEEERKQAWLEYEEEKQGKRQMINMGGMGMGMGMGMGNMANSMAFNQMLMNMNSFPELENIKLLIQKDYPNLPPEHLESVARQAVYDMYRYVDQQAVNQILNTTFPGQSMPATNMLGVPGMQTPQQPQQQQPQQFNQQSQLMNMLNQPQMNYPTNHMPVYSGRGRPPKHISVNNQMANIRQMQQLQQMQQQVQQQQQQNQIQPMVINNDEVQVLPNQEVPAPNIDSASNINDIQEE